VMCLCSCWVIPQHLSGFCSEFCFGVLFRSAESLVTLCRFVVWFRLLEKFDNFFKACLVCSVDHASD
jgi:hypothetical protein